MVMEDYLFTADGAKKELANASPEFILRKNGLAWTEGYIDCNGSLVWGEEISRKKGYNDIKYDENNDVYYVFKNGKIGVLRNKHRKGESFEEIIPTNRKYDKILIQPLSKYCRYFLFWKDGLIGACDSKGVEVVKPKYTTLMYDEVKGFVTKDNDQWNSIGVYLDFVGRGYKSSENLFYKYAEEGDKQMKRGNFSTAIASYNKARKYLYSANTKAQDNLHNNIALAYYNMGVASYNQKKYKKASKLFNNAYQESDGELKFALEMRDNCDQMALQKSVERTNAILGTLAMVSVAMIDVGTNIIANNGMYIPYGYTPVNGVSANYNYLLDPNYAIWQANQQQAQFNAINQQLINLSIQQTEQQEYETYLLMTSGGTSMSYEEWKSYGMLAAFNESNYNQMNPMIEDESHEYNGKLSPDQYEQAYRRYENSAQSNFNLLTNGGIRSQDSHGNITGRTVGQMPGGSYVSAKQGLRKAQEDMRRIRQEAAQYGVIIQQSQWETATAGY